MWAAVSSNRQSTHCTPLTSAEGVRSTPSSVVLARPHFRPYEVISLITAVEGYPTEGGLCVSHSAVLHCTRQTAHLSYVQERGSDTEVSLGRCSSADYLCR